MKDFSFWEEYEGAVEGSGQSEKIWLINPDTSQTGLFKFKKDISTTVAERKMDQHLGNDLILRRSLVYTKSKSIIRIACRDRKQPTHLEVIKYIKKNYYEQTIDIVKRVEKFMTEEAISIIMGKYGEVLSAKKAI